MRQCRIRWSWLVALTLIGGPIVAPVIGSTGSTDPAPTLADADYGDDYRSGDFGRIREAADGVTLLRAEQRANADPPGSPALNVPIFPGDSLSTGADQRVDIQLAGGLLVRMDRWTELTFLALPDPYAEFADNGVLQVGRGRIALTGRMARDDEMRIDTPAASIYPLGDSDLRIEVDDDGRTRVYSRRGSSEVVGNGGSVIVRAGTRTEVHPGATPYSPQAFNTFATTAFDLWVEQRDARYAGRIESPSYEEVYDELPYEVRPYYRELSLHGHWVDTPDYGYVWAPAGRRDGWRPYSDGYWCYGPKGYFWVSHETWGWAPYHYGRWAWVGGSGWCWIPGRVFAGAWVAWSWGPAYVGWSALGYWNQPIYHSSLHYGYYDPHAWTFISYRHIKHHHYHPYTVSLDHLGHHVHRAAVVTRPPRVSPRALADSGEQRQRALLELHENRARHVRPVTSGEPRGSSFARVEDRWVRDHLPGVRTARGAVTARGGQSGRSDVVDRQIGPARRSTLGRGGKPDSTGYPRQLSRRGRDIEPASRDAGRTSIGQDRADTPRPASRDHLGQVYRKVDRTPQTRTAPRPGGTSRIDRSSSGNGAAAAPGAKPEAPRDSTSSSSSSRESSGRSPGTGQATTTEAPTGGEGGRKIVVPRQSASSRAPANRTPQSGTAPRAKAPAPPRPKAPAVQPRSKAPAPTPKPPRASGRTPQPRSAPKPSKPTARAPSPRPKSSPARGGSSGARKSGGSSKARGKKDR